MFNRSCAIHIKYGEIDFPWSLDFIKISCRSLFALNTDNVVWEDDESSILWPYSLENSTKQKVTYTYSGVRVLPVSISFRVVSVKNSCTKTVYLCSSLSYPFVFQLISVHNANQCWQNVEVSIILAVALLILILFMPCFHYFIFY